jgi:hypothetical protein
VEVASALLVPAGGVQVVQIQLLDPAGQASKALAKDGLDTNAAATPADATDRKTSRRFTLAL